jgi:hypothetical protein
VRSPFEIDPRAEVAGAKLGDQRLTARAEQIADRLMAAPDRSFPSAAQSDAELEALYRFLSNSRVTLPGLLEPHFDATMRRCELSRSPLVLHDTTEFRFEGVKHRDGLGELPKGQGFYGHFALAVGGDENHVVLGLAGLLTYTRTDDKPIPTNRLDPRHRDARRKGESRRWLDLIKEVDVRMGHVTPVHIMDREADDFATFSAMVRDGMRFVARMTSQRRRKASRSEDSEEWLDVETILENAPVVATREVALSRRLGKGKWQNKTHPPRQTRPALLNVSAATVTVAPPRRSQMSPLRLSIVRVAESKTPPGETPIEWMLLTQEPIASKEEILAIVDMYRARWIVEEYFKALKTGCAIEKRQLESMDALLAALGLYAPIAARLLALRDRARSTPDAPASVVLDEVEIRALRTIAKQPISARPTVKEAHYAIAGLGGHLKRNGDPGWLTLARGYEQMQIAARVVAAILDGALEK